MRCWCWHQHCTNKKEKNRAAARSRSAPHEAAPAAATASTRSCEGWARDRARAAGDHREGLACAPAFLGGFQPRGWCPWPPRWNPRMVAGTGASHHRGFAQLQLKFLQLAAAPPSPSSNFSYRSDSVTRYRPVALRVRAAQSRARIVLWTGRGVARSPRSSPWPRLHQTNMC